MKEWECSDANKMATDMLHFLKSIFRTNIQCMLMFHDQNIRMFKTLLDQGLIAQQETINVLHEWTENTRKATLDFQKASEENFEKLQQFFK